MTTYPTREKANNIINTVRPINSTTNEMEKFLERHKLQKLI